MLVLNLIQNIALLVALAVAYQIIGARWEQNHLKHQILAGLLFGVVGVVGMMTPVKFLPGIIFDGRSIILSVAGLFGGPLVALIAALGCGAYRLALGGAGAAMGVSVIAEAAALGVGFHYLRRRMTRPPGAFSLWVFGLLVHVLMLGCAWLLPEAGRQAFWRQLGVVVIVLYPVATMLVCMLFLDYETGTEPDSFGGGRGTLPHDAAQHRRRGDHHRRARPGGTAQFSGRNADWLEIGGRPRPTARHRLPHHQ